MAKLRIFFLVFSVINGHVVFSQSLCWKITSKDLKQSSYLFGTMHTTDKRVFNFSDKTKTALNETNVYVMEMDMTDFDAASLFKEMVNPANSLKKSLSAADYAIIDSIVEERVHLPVAMLDNLQPILISTFLETTKDDEEDTSSVFLDMYLMNWANEHHKTVKGLETADEQIRALNSLSYKDQIDLLVKGIHDKDNGKEAFEAMMNNYVKGNIDSLLALSDEAKMPAQFMDALIDKRNKRMADRIAQMIPAQSHFIAVGALHLPGEKGVINLLRRKGFTVVPF